MAKTYQPSQQDVATPQGLNRVLSDIIERIRALEQKVQELANKISKS